VKINGKIEYEIGFSCACKNVLVLENDFSAQNWSWRWKSIYKIGDGEL